MADNIGQFLYRKRQQTCDSTEEYWEYLHRVGKQNRNFKENGKKKIIRIVDFSRK